MLTMIVVLPVKGVVDTAAAAFHVKHSRPMKRKATASWGVQSHYVLAAQVKVDLGRKDGQFIGRVSIDDRPEEAWDRSVPGSLEEDLIFGQGDKRAVATLVDRPSTLLIMLGLTVAADFPVHCAPSYSLRGVTTSEEHRRSDPGVSAQGYRVDQPPALSGRHRGRTPSTVVVPSWDSSHHVETSPKLPTIFLLRRLDTAEALNSYSLAFVCGWPVITRAEF